MSDASLIRWRLVLGESSHVGLGSPVLDAEAIARDAALAWLYQHEPDQAARDIRPQMRQSREGGEPEASEATDTTRACGPCGGQGPSVLTVPHWINTVHRLFPKQAIERLERDAVVRYHIDDVVTNPDVLRNVTPSQPLLEAVLRVKHLMNPEVLDLARDMAARVVRELMDALAREVRMQFGATIDRRRPSHWKSARNFDARRTIRENLRHWSVEEQRLYIERPRFVARTHRHRTTWQIILLVDQSGSMLSSVIHAAVTAACFWGLPALKTHLCAFDTEVVDLTSTITDPVDALMKVQLGGGTNIARAVAYASTLIENPRQAMVVIISDFFEGCDRDRLVQHVKRLREQGTHVLGLAALDSTATPSFDRDLAGRLVEVGAQIGAMTPGQLAAWVAEKVRA